MGGGRYSNDPDTLLNICIRYCLDNLFETVADPCPVRLKPNTFLPKEICEKMLEFANRDSESFDTEVLQLFQVLKELGVFRVVGAVTMM